jgi:hypothetical protein
MRKQLLRITAGVLTLICGLLVHRTPERVPKAQFQMSETPCVTAAPLASTAQASRPEFVEYPDNLGLEPRTIEEFIMANPKMNLTGLWDRFHLKEGDRQLGFCNKCEAEMFVHELDGLGDGEEVLLRVGDDYGDRWMFLVFTWDTQTYDWRFVGVINVFDRYNAPDHSVVVSRGRPYLVISELGAYGSGLGLYQRNVYQVGKDGLRQVFSFLGKGSLSGVLGYEPGLSFDTHVISFRARPNGTVVTEVEYTLEYCYGDLPILAKRKRLTLTGGSRYGAPLTRSAPERMDYESQSTDFLTSMTGDDFLKYNLPELKKLATQGTRDQKSWLRNYLKTCENSKAKRHLLAALAN